MNWSNFENKTRTECFSKSTDDEKFLNDLNDTLQPLECQIMPDFGDGVPNVFVIGLPRSGTTLLYQILCHCLDTSWPTNLMARFWKTPLIGLRLSKILDLYEAPLQFQSAYGVSSGANGPHEFGYFWMNLFQYPDVCIRPPAHEDHIDWKALDKTINRISSLTSKPFIYKNLIPAFHLNRLSSVVKNSLFIFLERDPADIAISMLAARRRRYENEAVCWSFRPSEYDTKAKDLTPHQQIVLQISSIAARIEKEKQGLSSDRTAHFTHEKVTTEPMEVVRKVAGLVSRHYPPASIRRSVESFGFKTYRGSKEYEKFQQALADENHFSDI